MRCTAAVPCHVFFVHGALRSVTEAESSRLPALEGVTPAAARTILFLVLPVRSCREGPEHFGPTLLAFPWIASAVVCQSTHASFRLLSNRLSGKTQAKSSLKALTSARKALTFPLGALTPRHYIPRKDNTDIPGNDRDRQETSGCCSAEVVDRAHLSATPTVWARCVDRLTMVPLAPCNGARKVGQPWDLLVTGVRVLNTFVVCCTRKYQLSTPFWRARAA